jgi:Zn-dependent protease with chaperone function
MAALQALRPAAGGIARNPVLLVIAALFGVSQLPNLLIQPTRPLLASGISLATTGLLILAVAVFHVLYGLFRFLQFGGGRSSGNREYAADRAAAEITGSPAALAGALKTLDESMSASPRGSNPGLH